MGMAVSEQIRKLIEDAPVSRHRLCQLAKVSAGNLAGFMKKNRGLSNESLDRVGAVLGLKVTMDMKKVRALAKDAPSPGRPPKTES